MHAHNFIDLTGQTLGRWHIESFYGRKGGQALWNCRCTCPKQTKKVVPAKSLRRNGGSCGCLKIEILKARVTTHGHTRGGKGASTRTYRAWRAMNDRCLNPQNQDYAYYGGRGIRIYSPWLAFENFLADNGECPLGYTLDRFPNQNGDYEPGNVRWATMTQQQRNRRSNHLMTFHDVTKTMIEWSEDTGIPYRVLNDRKRWHWSDEKALTEPVRRHRD